MDLRTIELLTMYEALQLRDVIDNMCQETQKEEDSPDLKTASIQGFEGYIKKSKEKLMTAIRNCTDNIRTNRTTTTTRKQKWEEKQRYGYFKRQTSEISY